MRERKNISNGFPLCIAKCCMYFHLFVKKHISSSLIVSDGAVCLSRWCYFHLCCGVELLLKKLLLKYGCLWSIKKVLYLLYKW